jgi:D-alanine-D-alanine ligase
VGLTLVEDETAIAGALDCAFEESSLVMAEKYVKGREITIAILDGAPLPPVEIKPTHKLYDYTCKYTKGKSQYFCPADIDPDLNARLSAEAVLFYNTIGCRGYARVDFIVTPDGAHECLELNTLPGMTELSLFPMAAKAAGFEFSELLEKLCYLAMEDR